jgi:hypothetical protein
MPTPTDLLTGLAGAGGCVFRPAANQLLYVEFSGNLSATNIISPAHTVLGTGYANPEDLELSGDGVHGYITERSGNLVKASLSTPNRSAATVIASGMVAPQQMALDEAHNAAYVVEFAAAGNLYRINLTTGVKTPVPVTLTFAVGLVITSDLQFAYITEQTPGPDKGRVRRIRLSDGFATTIVTGLTNPFFLTWGDPAEASLLVPERDPANRVTRVDLATNTTSLVAGGFSSRPGSIALVSPSRMLVHGETTISIVDFLAFLPAGPLFMGFGFIPFDKVNQSGPNLGLADTTTPPGYFYQVKNTPFGGTLPIMVNYPAATALGATFYRIKVDSAYRLDTWTDEKWNGTTFVPDTVAPVPIGGHPSYPVRTSPFLFMNPALGSLLDSTNLSNALHTLEVEFVNGSGVVLATSPVLPGPYRFRVDNNQCVGVLAAPAIGATMADSCGILRYTSPAQVVTMGLTASHPNNFADFSFSLIRGHNNPPPPVIIGLTSGPVSSAPAAITGTVAGLLGPCSGMAAFAESLYVAATANSGWSRQSQYDASDLLAFTLAH